MVSKKQKDIEPAPKNSKTKKTHGIHKVPTHAKEVLIESNTPKPALFLMLDNLKVANQIAYNEFMAMSSSVWLSEKRYYRSTYDKLLQIDLLLRKTDFERSIIHLPESEKVYITALKFIVEKAYLAITKLKNQATGQDTCKIVFNNYTAIDDKLIIDNRKADIIALFGKMYKIDEVHKIITKDWKIDVSISALEYFRDRNLDKIIELQKDYSNNYNDVRLGYKKSRLEEYLWLYNDTKQTYENTRNKEDRKFLKELLEAIKREVEGDLIRIEGDLQVNIEATLNLHIYQEIYKNLPINEIIMTRIALKSGQNPLMLLYRLQNSYYAKYSGFAPKNDADDESALPEYPSAFIYDLDKLGIMNANRVIADGQKKEEFAKFIEVTKENKTASLSIKEILLKKIKQRKDDLEKGIIKIG
jgi:hypothetical protein